MIIILDNSASRNYIIGAVIVWLGIFVATFLTLEGTDELSTMLIIQAGGAFWFIVIAPQLFNRAGRQRDAAGDERNLT